MIKKLLFAVASVVLFAVGAAPLLVPTPALAVDFAKPITQIDGKTALRDEEKNIVTLGSVAENALLAKYQDEPNLAGEEQMKRFSLARKIHDQRKDPSLTPEELALIKKLVAKVYGPLVVGEVWTELDKAVAAAK